MLSEALCSLSLLPSLHLAFIGFEASCLTLSLGDLIEHMKQTMIRLQSVPNCLNALQMDRKSTMFAMGTFFALSPFPAHDTSTYLLLYVV